VFEGNLDKKDVIKLFKCANLHNLTPPQAIEAILICKNMLLDEKMPEEEDAPVREILKFLYGRMRDFPKEKYSDRFIPELRPKRRQFIKVVDHFRLDCAKGTGPMALTLAQE
jgi:hypothetical protein